MRSWFLDGSVEVKNVSAAQNKHVSFLNSQRILYGNINTFRFRIMPLIGFTLLYCWNSAVSKYMMVYVWSTVQNVEFPLPLLQTSNTQRLHAIKKDKPTYKYNTNTNTLLPLVQNITNTVVCNELQHKTRDRHIKTKFKMKNKNNMRNIGIKQQSIYMYGLNP